MPAGHKQSLQENRCTAVGARYSCDGAWQMEKEEEEDKGPTDSAEVDLHVASGAEQQVEPVDAVTS